MVGELEPATDKGDRSKYCTYYQVSRHDTIECNSLKNIINELVQKGLVDKFIKKDIKKPWNIFKKDNKKEEKMPEGDYRKKQDKLRILQGW